MGDDPNSTEAKTELTKCNEMLIAQNKKDGLTGNDEKRFTIDIKWYSTQLTLALQAKRTLLASPNGAAAKGKLLAMYDLMAMKAKQAGYPEAWALPESYLSTEYLQASGQINAPQAGS